MLVFTGDINLTDNSFDVGYGVGSLLEKGFDPFRFIPKEMGDVWVGNFEGVVSSVSRNKGYQKKSFRIDPRFLKGLSLIDYWGIANNHVMEHGPEAYSEMESVLGNIGKGVFGSLSRKTVIFTEQNKKIAISGFSLRKDQLEYTPLYWNFPEYSNVLHELELIKDSDCKIAFIHWGVEFITKPHWSQIKFAHWLVDCGFDLVLGMHPHILQGYETYKSKRIYYSLGNFVFNQAWKDTKYGAIVKLDLENNDVTHEYIMIGSDFCPRLCSAEKVSEHLRFENLNKRLNEYDNPEVYISEANRGLRSFRKANRWFILKNIHRNDKNVTFAILFDFFKRHLHF